MIWIKDENGGLPWLAGTKEGKATYPSILGELRAHTGNAVSSAIHELDKKYNEYVSKKEEEKAKQAVFTAIGNRDLALQAAVAKP